jgi:hypothetical protein
MPGGDPFPYICTYIKDNETSYSERLRVVVIELRSKSPTPRAYFLLSGVQHCIVECFFYK